LLLAVFLSTKGQNPRRLRHLYNEVLKANVTTSGVSSSQMDFSKSWSSAEIAPHSKNLVDSLLYWLLHLSC